MSETTLRFPSGVVDGVADYVREVRLELADLPLDDVDDLTSGMEADLSELAAESGGDLIGRLGSPSRYAAELRTAAGLPEREVGSGRRSRPAAQALANARSAFATLTRQHPWLRSVTSFLVALRPAWWLIRGYLAAWVLWSTLTWYHGIRPQTLKECLMAFLAIVVSVQLGRGWLRQRAGVRPLLVVANGVAMIVALMALGSGSGGQYNASTYSPPAGVSIDGAQVSNIYAYDSDGNRITGVRLFAQDGRPLGGGDNPFDSNGNPIGVVRDGSGAAVTNVYPRALVGPDPWQVINPVDPQMSQGAWTPPMSIVPLMPSATSTSTPSSTATPTPAATATAPAGTSKPVPHASASPTPSSAPGPTVTRSGG